METKIKRIAVLLATFFLLSIIATAASAADFTYARAPSGGAHNVAFTDTSTVNPISWSWNFGDGGTSNLRNPVYNFKKAGTYDVTLTIEYIGCDLYREQVTKQVAVPIKK